MNDDSTWQAQVQGLEQNIALSRQNSQLLLDAAQLRTGISLSTENDSDLYQRLELSGYPAKAPAAGGHVLSIERQYFNPQGEALSLHDLRSGDLVLVHLAVRASQRVPDALLVDLLPAGLELENQNLANSSANLSNASTELRDWQEAMQNTDIVHQEYRDDRYVAALSIPANEVKHILYLARAVTPGHYMVPPAQVESMYRPAWHALSASEKPMRIRAR